MTSEVVRKNQVQNNGLRNRPLTKVAFYQVVQEKNVCGLRFINTSSNFSVDAMSIGVSDRNLKSYRRLFKRSTLCPKIRRFS